MTKTFRFVLARVSRPNVRNRFLDQIKNNGWSTKKLSDYKKIILWS